MTLPRMPPPLLAGLFLLLSVSCARTPPPQLYLLNAAAPPSALTAVRQAVAVETFGIGPVILPEYLDRPQLVTRVTENRLEASDIHRWAEPLKEGVPRMLRENLSRILAPTRILVHPWQHGEGPSLRLRLEIQRFEAGPDEAMHLMAIWTIVDGNGRVAVAQQRSEIRIALEIQDYEARAAAASEALTRLGREIAATLAEAPAPRP